MQQKDSMASQDDAKVTNGTLTDANDPKNPEDPKETKSFADALYDKISSVIGGNNPNQFFCMSLPGTLVDPTQYSYDVHHNETKPAHVKANESKLVNKLFDACFMSAADNGRHLYTQYRTALNMLTPKMNGKLFDAKTKLREALMTPYPYNFGDGSDEILTLEQVFYRLYGDYVEAKQKWAQQQIDKKDELARTYKENTEENYKLREDKFLEWYGMVAEAAELAVEEKMGQVLSVFSPGDMEIINGILESGAGRELTEARNQLDNVEELNPDGGYVYPVTLYPQDWFELLDTSFTPADLLNSPAALAQRLTTLEMQRSSITANLNRYLNVVPAGKVADLKTQYDNCEKAFQTEVTLYTKDITGCSVDMLKTLVDVAAANGATGAKDEKTAEKVPESTICRILGIDSDKVKGILEKLNTTLASCLDAQNKLVQSASTATDTALEWINENNKVKLREMITPLKQQLDDVNEKIEALKEQIKLVTDIQPAAQTDASGKKVEVKEDIAPREVPDRFTQIIIDSSMSEVKQQSMHESSASQSSCGVSFFFGGYTPNSSHQNAVDQELNSSSNMEIQIGMSVAKVQIEREWFNPAILLLSSDMYNTSSEPISPSEDYHEISQARLDIMNECIFPCYPAAFVVARDVTIQFYSETAISSSFAQSVEEHSSKGGGFFIFGGSSSKASSSSESNSVATSSSNSVTVRFTSPQIIGYYLEALPPDKSTSISDTQTNSNHDFISIFDFITTFRQMLDDHNQKYNKKLLNLETEGDK